MAEPLDIYSDQFGLNVGAYGSVLNFFVSSPIPAAPGNAPPAERLATVRMSLEHLKVMAFVIRRQIVQYEQQTGVTIQIPSELLNSLRISREDWDAVWR